MTLKKIVSGSVLGLFVALTASANVSLKNGNFFIGYTDIIYNGGLEPKIERVYNSKTPYKGWFGWGWGNEYEVYLTVSADGSAIVHEYGGGAENRFVPLAFKPAELKKAVDDLVAVAQKIGVTGSKAQIEDYRKKLTTDAVFRNDEWEKFRAQGKIAARKLAEGTQLKSNKYSYQYITKVKDGYVRTFESGKTEKFDDEGHLIKILDKNNNFIQFTYGQDGKPQKLTDNKNRKMYFSFNKMGLMERIQSDAKSEATYKYNDAQELIQSKDVDNNTYTFKYSADQRHNLTEIGYTDKTTLKVAYHSKEKFENVKSVTDRDGSTTEYDYDVTKGADARTKVSIKVKGSDGKEISKSSYDYTIKTKADGELWTQRMVAIVDGDKTDTTYNEDCGLPVQIKRGDEDTTFDYDPKCRVTKKVAGGDVTELAYHPKAGKVSKVLKYPKANKSDSTWSEFDYDDKSNLVTAKNSQGKGLKLFYDNSGQIRSMVDQDKKRIDFKYNENSKPIEITDPSLGSIVVTYASNGEIKKVDSSAGRKVALQVTNTFQNLLEIIKPAGVNLSF